MKKVSSTFAFISIAFLFQHCSQDPIPANSKGVAAHWADVTLRTIQRTWPNSPTYTSRSLGYIGVTMYEAVVNGSPNHKSLAGQLNGLQELPKPEQDLEYNWTLALNAAQASILKNLYTHTTSDNIHLIDSLEAAIYRIEVLKNDIDVAERSVLFGRSVAEAIFEWSKTDGGHEGYLRNFDTNYIFPQGPGYWSPPLFGQSTSFYPLHPYWGNNRTFVAANAMLPVPKMIAYSTDPSSSYYKVFREVYHRRLLLTDEQKRIAAWWADDPTQSASPPGHSYNLATIAITTANADLFTAAETYAKVGMSVADAFICCWKAKYTYHSERPFRFIKEHIDPAYEQFWPEPPFPAFPSGHATQSAAAAITLISVYGNLFPILDNTYEKRAPDFFPDIAYRPRKFLSIWSTATECADSRLLGGIHTRQDNEAGADQGKKIGKNITALQWQR
jgi:hypothetical protein